MKEPCIGLPECNHYESTGDGFNDFCKHLCCRGCGSHPNTIPTTWSPEDARDYIGRFQGCDL